MKKSLLSILFAIQAVGVVSADPLPETLRLHAYWQLGDQTYREYRVSCNNRTEGAIFKQEGEREWCVYGPGEGHCQARKVEAAKLSCTSAANSSEALASQ